MIDNDTPQKCIDTHNESIASSGVGEGGRCFEQLAFGCVLELYSGERSSLFQFFLIINPNWTGATSSCLFTTDYDDSHTPVCEISIQDSHKLFDSASDLPITLPSHGGPAMNAFRYRPSSPFPVVKPKFSAMSPTSNSKITSPGSPCNPTLQNNGLVPITGELLDRIRTYHQRRQGFYCLKVRRLGFKRIMDEDHSNGITTHGLCLTNWNG